MNKINIQKVNNRKPALYRDLYIIIKKTQNVNKCIDYVK
jgi:hypothetical protein